VITVVLESNHPIASSAGFSSYDGKTHEIPSELYTDVEKLGALLTRKVGIRMNLGPGHSRMIDGVPHFFPKKYTTGVHCIRVVRA
jgi:hypothetical protein